MARKKPTQKQKQKQSQKVIVNIGGRGGGKGGGKRVVHHHHHSINQVLTDASSTHAVNNASNTLLGHIANMTKSFESRDAEREANAVRLSYGVNPTPAFIRGFNRPAQTSTGSAEERDAIARADAPNDNLIDARMPVARGYRRIVNAEPAESSSDETVAPRRRYVVNSPRGKNITSDPNSPIPVQVAVSKRLIEDEADLALNGLSLQNPSDMTAVVPFQDNPMMSNANLKPNVSSGALTLIQSKTAKEYPRVNYNITNYPSVNYKIASYLG